MKSRRKICVVTGSRAEYGLLRWVMGAIRDRPMLQLQVVATGSHLEPHFGMTVNEIVSDGFDIEARVEIGLSSDAPMSVAESYAKAVSGVAGALNDLAPDVVVVLGDRFEIQATAVGALLARIPLAHIHGGEITTGSIDEQFRHSITKMAQGHFVSLNEYRNRVIQLGEDPETVKVVGGLGFESVRRTSLLSRDQVEHRIGMKLKDRNLLVVFHPETAAIDFGKSSLIALLSKLSELREFGFVVSLPNPDIGNSTIRSTLLEFCGVQTSCVALESMGRQLFLSCMSHVDGIVGNSSSGLLEAPALGVATLDVGCRQSGRIALQSVLRPGSNPGDIGTSLMVLLSEDHREICRQVRLDLAVVPTSELICDGLESDLFGAWKPKVFYDLGARKED